MKRILPIALFFLASACQAHTPDSAQPGLLPEPESDMTQRADNPASARSLETSVVAPNANGNAMPDDLSIATPPAGPVSQGEVSLDQGGSIPQDQLPTEQQASGTSPSAIAPVIASGESQAEIPGAEEPTSSDATLDAWQTALAGFLTAHVRRGGVDYTAAARDPRLATVRAGIADANPASMSPEARKAFFINAYNVLVIAAVCDRLPVSSVMDIPDFFKGIKHPVGGEQLSLDELEKGTLYKEFPDPRLHFALVCGAEGCPPLRPLAYSAEGLDAALEETSRQACNDPQFMRISEKVAGVSQIFVWYLDDFGGTIAQARSFINSYRKEPIPEKANWSPYPYDWSLNDVLEK